MDKLLVWMILGILVLVMTVIGMAYVHEAAHAEICRKFGATYANITMFADHPYTICDAGLTPEYKLAQSNVESFGYQLGMAVVMIEAMIFFLGMILVDKR